jgi:hypothetical protein
MQDLENFTFAGEFLEDIKSGLQPFIVADGSAEHRQANLELARTYGLLASGEQSLLLADLEALKAKEIQSIPLTYFELERNLGMFGNLLGTVLGPAHTLTLAFRAFWNLLSQGFCMEVQQIIDNKGYVKPTHILRSVQLVCYTWFTQKWNRLILPPPDFTSILYMLTLNTYLLPHLPPILYKLAYPKPQAFTALPPDLISSSDGSKSAGSKTSGTSDASTVSGLSDLMGLTDAGRKKGSFIANLKPDDTLVNLINSMTKIRDLMGNSPPPSWTMDPRSAYPFCFAKDAGPPAAVRIHMQPL